MNRWMMAALLWAGCSVAVSRAAGVVAEPETPCMWSAAYAYNETPARPDDPVEARKFDIRAASNPRPLNKRVVEDGEVRRESMQWVGGGRSEHWIVGIYQIYTRPNWPPDKASRRQFESAAQMERRREPFPELSWITPQMEKGTKRFEGKSALYFEEPASENVPEEDRLRAWLDPDTRLPIAMADAEKTITYSFSSGKPGPNAFEMPSGIAEMHRRMKTAGELETHNP